MRGVWKVVSLPFKSRSKNIQNPQKFDILEKWEAVLENMKKGGEANFKSAILDMDKIFSEALAQAGFEGETFADRLRPARDAFPRHVYKELWQAHRFRNRAVHDLDFQASSFVAESARRSYEKGLKELRIL